MGLQYLRAASFDEKLINVRRFLQANDTSSKSLYCHFLEAGPNYRVKTDLQTKTQYAPAFLYRREKNLEYRILSAP